MSLLQKYVAASVLVIGVVGLARAEDSAQRAILNSSKIMTHLHSVWPAQLHIAVAKVADPTYKRVAPEQPIWILETLGGSILYYQGNPSFKGQAADRLVDDTGARFGLKAIGLAKSSSSGWIALTLGGTPYRAYCKSQYPLVVCSLALGAPTATEKFKLKIK